MSEQEQRLARQAADVIAAWGGFVSFNDYDALMSRVFYFAPLHWVCSLARPRSVGKANTDKLCAFAAVKMGLITQTNGGYLLGAALPNQANRATH